MFDDNDSRRQFLKGSGVTVAALSGLAGCTGDDGDPSEASGDDGGDDSEELIQREQWEEKFGEFDPENHQESLPHAMPVLYDHDLHRITVTELHDIEERDEPHHGGPVWEKDDDEEWLEPDFLQFSIAPDEETAVYRDAYEEFLGNIEDETGLDVEFTELQSFAAEVEAMRSERLHIAAFSTGTVPYAVNLAGAVPYAIMVDEQEDQTLWGVRNWLIAHIDNDEITELADIAGKDVAHVTPSSNSGHQAPSALYTEMGVEPGEDYEIEFSGAHEQSAIGVEIGDYDAAPTCSGCPERFAANDVIDLDSFRVVESVGQFMPRGFSYYYRLHPDIQEGIERAAYDYDYSGTPMDTELDLGNTFVEIDYNTHWHTHLLIQEFLDVEYDEPPS